MAMSFSGKTAIAGIGATDFSKCSGRSTLRLAVEACEAAIRDAGITPDMIDGMVTYTVDDNHEIDVCRSLGTDRLTHFSRIHHSGGAACGTIGQGGTIPLMNMLERGFPRAQMMVCGVLGPRSNAHGWRDRSCWAFRWSRCFGA